MKTGLSIFTITSMPPPAWHQQAPPERNNNAEDTNRYGNETTNTTERGRENRDQLTE